MSNTDTEFNKLTGDADLVLAKSRRYEELGQAIARSVSTLKRISEGDGQKSQAIDALQDSAKNVARDIGKAEERYSLTAKALLTYAGKLREAQDDAVSAISAIGSADSDVAAAESGRIRANLNAEAPGEDQVANAKAAAVAEDTLTASTHALGSAHELWHTARQRKDDAASVAASEIDDVVNGKVGDELNDSAWDDLKSFSDTLKVICEVAGVLSIFLAWVPILGAVLIGLAILGALLTLVDASVKLSRGEGSVSDVVFAAVGVVLAAIGGKLVTQLVKIAKFKSAANIANMTKGSKGYLNSGEFRTMFGVSKKWVPRELTSATSFKGFTKEVLKNPFELKLGEGTNVIERWKSGATSEYLDFLSNPFKLKVTDMPLDHLTRGATVTLGVIDFRTLGGGMQSTITLFTDSNPSIKPESMLKDASNRAESQFRK